MSLTARFSQRIAQPDAQQYLALYLIALLFALMAAWPTPSAPVNDAWFTLAYTRAAALGLLGLGYGASVSGAQPREIALTGAMLALFALLALPLELAAYAASFPATPLAWVIPLPALTVVTMFAIGLLLGRLFGLLRLQPLLPLAVPAALAGMVALDVVVRQNLFNPFTAAVRVSWSHLALLGVVTVALILALWRTIEGTRR